jgi:peroxiredoxin
VKHALTPLVALLATATPSGASGATAGSEGAQRPGPINRGSGEVARTLVDRAPPALPALAWTDGKPRTLKSLAGKVVVIRNFTDGCPFCVTTLPALQQIHLEYAKRGVLVLGVYHPKPPRPVTIAEAGAHARKMGASFPVAADPSWSLVNAWWLDHPGTTWTSVTWVLDRAGKVRLIHPGGEYHEGGGADHAQCRADDQSLRQTLDRLLAE